MLDNFLVGLSVVMQFKCLMALPIGMALGMLAGAMPGLSAGIAVAILLPFTFGWEPAPSLLLLVAVYCGAEYAGSITAISINTPGTPAAAATCIDGYECTRKGYPGKALGASIVASTCGGIISTIFLIILAFPIAEMAMKFGAPEYFALGVFGMTTIATLSGKLLVKGFIAGLIGLILRTSGMDPITLYNRFTFDIPNLLDGVAFIPALIGCFAMSEVFMMIEEITPLRQKIARYSSSLPNWQELKDIVGAMIAGSLIGTFIGAIPGAGGSIASWITYDQVKRFSKDRHKFGTGILKGIAAPESANNATVGGALIPLLTLGIPGSGTTAVLLGAFMLHELEPGPRLFVNNPDIVYSIFVGLMAANLWMLLFGLVGTKLWVRVIATPKNILAPLITLISFIGSYAYNNNVFDMGLMLAFGIGSYLLRKLELPVVPIVLALVLGEMVESNFRRALIQSQGSYSIFYEHYLCLFLLLLSVLFFIIPLSQEWYAKRRISE